MNIINYYCKNVLMYDLINKFFYTNINNIPKLKKIILNFSCKKSDLKILATTFLALELITTKSGKLTLSKKSNVLFRIRKGNPVGCSIILEKHFMYRFFSKLFLEVFPLVTNFKGFYRKKIYLKHKTSFSFTIKDLVVFNELNDHFYLFSKLPPLNITIVTNNITQKEEFVYFIKALKIIIDKKI